MHDFILTLSLAFMFVGCAPARQYQESAVVPASATPEEEAAIRSALVGEWRNWSTVYSDGDEIEEKTFRVFMTFREDGSGDQGLGDKRSPFTYRLDGKNIMTTDPNYPALRVESVDANELRLFWYKLSVTLVYKRPSAFTGLRR